MAFPKRSAELVKLPYIREQLTDVYRAVERGFMAQMDRSNDLQDYWKIWNCERSTNQFYSGNTKVYVPLVRNAVKALRRRWLNQAFPDSGRHVAVISHDDISPDAEVALLEHYIRRADLRSLIMPGLMVAGIVEGQASLLVTWQSRKRSVVERIPQPIRLMGMDMPPEVAEPVMSLKASEIEDAGPDVEVVLDADLLVLPTTADKLSEALDLGGSVTVLRRWDEAKIEWLIEEGEIDADSGEELLGAMRKDTATDQERLNLDTAGIKGKNDFALVYRTWTKLEVGTGKDRVERLCLVYFAGEHRMLSCRLCPYWCDKPDVISVPLDKLPGNFKGLSQIKPGVAEMQYVANDLMCEGLDNATFTMLPPVRYDPDKVPNVDALIMDLKALWPAPAGAIETIQFPDLLPKAFEAVLGAERMINLAMGVTPSEMAQLPTNRKMNQAEVAQVQRIELLMTDTEVHNLESGMLDQLVTRFAEYDAQFRDREKTVRAFGELGLKVEMVTVPPIQMGRRWEYVWWGVQASRSAQQIQQQIAAVNVIAPMAQHPSVMEAGKRLNLVPLIAHVVEAAFSPRLAPKIFQDIGDQVSLDPEMENQMMAMGLQPEVSPFDNDPQHMQVHQQLLAATPPGTPAYNIAFRHQQLHAIAMGMKAQAQMQAAMGAQMQQPGGQPRRGGRGPTPSLPGAQPQQPRPLRGPPGALHPDQMPKAGGVIPMPRRM